MVSTSGTVNETLVQALVEAVSEIRYLAFEAPETENCGSEFRRGANKKIQELNEIIGKAQTGRINANQAA